MGEGAIYIEGRPDFADHSFGKVLVKNHPPYVYSTGHNGMLIHKVLYMEAHWYSAQYDRLLRLESPKLIAVSICQQHFFIHMPRERRGKKFSAALCELPAPEAVPCGRCHGMQATFGKRSKWPCSKAEAKVRLGCAVRGWKKP